MWRLATESRLAEAVSHSLDRASYFRLKALKMRYYWWVKSWTHLIKSAGTYLCLCSIAIALGTGAHNWLCCGKDISLRLVLSNLCPCIHDATDETDEDGRYTSECDRGCEENETTDSDWQLVESTNHRVGCGGSDTDTPSRAVWNEDSSKTRVDHAENEVVSGLKWEVLGEVLGWPVFENEGANEEDRNGEKVVVEHS